MSKYICLILVIFLFSQNVFAGGEINSITIAERAAKHYLEYTHFKLIGVCLWLQCHGVYCKIHPKAELDEYLPDLVVTVYNKLGDNPWFEANKTLDKAGYRIGNALIKRFAPADLGNGNTNTLSAGSHYDSIRTKSVDVIGNPFMLIHFPFPSLRSDTKPFMPYYQSDLDSLSRFISFDFRTFIPKYYIGSSVLNHWAYEFPRSMTVNVENDYKASVIVALRAADLVTNNHLGRTVKGTSNSCGKNCAVSNVIEEMKDKNEIWQEIYPLDRHIRLGENDLTKTDSLGRTDEAAGHGNYVFVVWRHYRGCVQADGRLIYATVHVPKTQKR